MGDRNAALTPADVSRLPGGCSSCLRWERFVDRGVLDGDGRDGDARTGSATDIATAKQRWWTEALASGSVRGLVVRAGSGGPADAIAGYVSYAIPARSGRDALTVLALHVDPGCRGVGLGRALVHTVAREALRRPRVRAVEALAGRGAALERCLVPLDFWLACGFTVVREHPTTPRVRLDARGLAGWRTEVEGAVELAWNRLRGAVRPEPAPGPALSREVRNSASAR